MKIRNCLTAAVAAALFLPGLAPAQDAPMMLEITEIDIKPGHYRKFAAAMESYKDCYIENDGENGWSVWWDMEASSVHIVSSMDKWAEMDEQDAASMACWSIIEEDMAQHITAVQTSFARHMPDWSGEASGYDVVRLHQFRVEDGELFSETVGTITGIMREAEYEHMGTWYDYIGNNAGEPGYFVVEHYENFAAMDEDRAGAYGTIVEAAGEERADELWEQFGDSLHDDWEYRTLLLSRAGDLGYDPDDD